MFTGLNNLGVNTVCSNDDVFSGAIGFTPEEVEALLAYYGLESRRDVVRQWYDGYRLASSEIYCPWDVLMFCAESLRQKDPLSFRPVKFWADTSDNAILDDFLGFIDGEDADRMQALVDGGEITIKLNEQVTFSDLKVHRSEDFWTLLLFTGYLTVAGRDGEAFRLKIPNEAVRDEFRERIQKRFTAANSDFSQAGRTFALAAVSGETNAMRQVLFDVLENYVSVRDSATKAKAENFYHGFLLALLAGAGKTIHGVRSNAEAGDGYADILFTSSSMPLTGVVIEVKHAGSLAEMAGAAEQALRQIRDKRYVRGLEGLDCEKVFGCGIAFHGKSCVIKAEVL